MDVHFPLRLIELHKDVMIEFELKGVSSKLGKLYIGDVTTTIGF